jgi:ribosomal protein S18 acetylase RimI-like enzyme
MRLFSLGEPFVRLRSESDCWLGARLFSATCSVVMHADTAVGAAVALRSQNDPDDVYMQDVVTHPGFRRRGIARSLIEHFCHQAQWWSCRRLHLTSEPGNTTATAPGRRSDSTTCQANTQ